MIYFICWVVFLVALILSVAVAHFMGNRGDRAGRSRAVADESNSAEDADMVAEEASFDDAQPADSFDELPAGDFPADEFPPAAADADDFAAFEEEFK